MRQSQLIWSCIDENRNTNNTIYCTMYLFVTDADRQRDRDGDKEREL